MAPNNNRFTVVALLVTVGVITTVSSGILFLLNSNIASVKASSEFTEVDNSKSLGGRIRSAFAGPCEKDVTSLEAAASFLSTCDNPETETAFVNRGRALLISWDEESTAAEKEQRVEQIAEDFDKAGELSSGDPEIDFYQAFVLDFKDFALNQKREECVPAGERYAKAIDSYSKVQEINPEEHNLFIVNELGHFLTNRDKDYESAIGLYEKVSDEHPEIEHILMSKATAQLLSKDFFGAKDSFERVLELNPKAYQVKYSLGSLWAQLENYEQALRYYREITNNPNTSEFYYAWRDQAIAYYLMGQYEEALQSVETALKYEGAAFFDEKNYAFLEKVAECLSTSDPSSVSCFGISPSIVRATLRDNGIFQGSVIVHNRDERSDPFFAVEHDSFYRCNQV